MSTEAVITPPNPRRLAAEAVVRVTRDRLPLALASEADRLASRDRNLAFEIAFGTVRHLTLLEAALARYMARPIDPKHHWLRAVLTTALYQATYLRVPDRAAVHEAVALIKDSPDWRKAAFVNAVLRKAVVGRLAAVWEEKTDPLERLALQYAHPPWMVARWLRYHREAEVVARLTANNTPAPLTLRTHTLRRDRAALLAAQVSVGSVAAADPPEAILVPSGGAVTRLPGFSEGWFAVQDRAAQWVSRLLNPQPGETILDGCAAPGGKTAHLAALAGGEALIVAVEKSAARLVRLEDTLRRLSVPGVTVLHGDLADPSLLQGRHFDRMLIDAPCTGTGIIRRHPDIKWHRRPKDLSALMAEQSLILSSVAPHLRPGGVLVYATCSMEPEECEGQIKRFLARHPGWHRDPLRAKEEGIPSELVSASGDFRVEPGQLGMDGFYAARLQAPMS